VLPRRDGSESIVPRAPGSPRAARWRQRITRKRVALGLLALVVGWVALSLVLFLVSSHIERTSPAGDVSSVLDPAGFPLTSANNILVLGSDRRQKNSKEPGAETTGPGRSDTIMLIPHRRRPRRATVDPARHRRRNPRPRAAEDQRRPRLRRPRPVDLGDQELARHPDQPRRGSQLRRLPAADRRDGRRRLHRRMHRLHASMGASARAATPCA